MSIKNYVEELEQIKDEIKRNNNRNQLLHKRIKELEKNISDFLIEKGQPGVKYKGRAITIETTEGRPTKKKKDKEKSVLAVLEKLGISDTEKAYIELQNAQKGEPISKTKLIVKNIR
jgi:hypothetical protein